MALFSRRPSELVRPEQALPGRAEPISAPRVHFVLGTELVSPFPEGTERALFAEGCFWGAERRFWQTEGVYTTAVGYTGGFTPNPTYEEVCSGRTGHAEAVLVVFWPEQVSYEELVASFFEGHDPTQLMRQGNDIGSQYRSALYVESAAQREQAEAVRDRYAKALEAGGYGSVVTEITDGGPFYYAEDYHQQYLAKNPG
ncbi:MAG: peptide-methionine (S)-S-oxide reductase, partial [Acidimicrobiaceae bacterium]|nr:peptide-methionine (S)-S-oxide reductase [Acidimicrobiaceae bacterium]